MAYNYLYIDDNKRAEADGVIAGLTLKDILSVEFKNPAGEWELERNRIESDEFKKYDGIILDLNLEENKNPENHKLSRYKGSTLAQEIRNLSKSGKVKETPIILLSATKNLNSLFDETNKDLFDLIISKESLTGKDEFETNIRKLEAIAQGYLVLSNERNASEIMAKNLENEDIRFLSEIEYQLSKPSHSISNFFIKEILEKNGILISEEILFARLGVDVIASKKEDISKIKVIFSESLYAGIFSGGWNRWWMSKIEKFWKNISENKTLRSLDAEERVSLLNEKFKLTLKASELDPKSKSLKFWTICQGSGRPIDNVDGLLVARQQKTYPWQDKVYISFEEALKPTNKDAWQDVNENEKVKLEFLKKKFPNERPARQ
jgi:hypothetical protein